MGHLLSMDLLDHHPGRLQQWEGDKPNTGRNGKEQGIAHLPAEQDAERSDTDQGGQPIANGNAPEQNAGTQNGADGSAVGALDEPLQVGTIAMASDNGCRDEDEEK